MVLIDSERCTGCGACVQVCPVGAIRVIEGETGDYAEIDQEECRQCEACIEACPEQAILSQIEPVMEGEIIEVKAKPVPVRSQPRQVRPVRPAPKALIWLGPVLAFAGREIVPRVAAALLDAWDRRFGRPASSLNELTSVRSAQWSMPGHQNGPPRGGRRRRRRGRGG
jgi:NAD-dependent dihydropyrimidine dehydrogenase PreA subunit